ncbi:MAG TPA: alpha/beta fold hydrolase [Methylomirabilota bacterium]|nr:alpha/beta fold hydrolase [Methylomirabilota bacterium]
MFAFVGGAPLVSRPLLRLVYRRIGGRIRSRLSSPADAARHLFAGPARGAQLAAVERYAATSDEAGLAQEICDYVAALDAVDAIVDDVTAYRRPWPFRMADLAVPLVLWHGSADPAAPAAVAAALAEQSAVASVRIFDGEGHFVFHTHGDAVVASIAAAQTPSRGVA